MKIYGGWLRRELEIVFGKGSVLRFIFHKFYCGTKERITGFDLMIKGHEISLHMTYKNWNKE